MPKDVRIIPAQGSIDFSLSQGFVTSLIQLSDAGLLSIASTGPIQVGATTLTGIRVAQNGFVGIGTISPTQNLHIQGNTRLTGALFDSNNNSGSQNQLLISTGSGVAWTSVNVTGILTASGGVSNRVAKFLDEDTLGNSSITDDGTLVTIGVGVSVLGFTTSTGFFGPGTFLTNLNASNLASGTVPSAVVSGAYSGITSVGSLTSLNVTGFSTLTNVRITNSLYDANFSPGTSNQVLISTGTGIAWTTSTATGILTGAGIVNTVPKFNTPNSLTNSNITDNGIAVTVNSRINVVGIGSFTNDLIVNQITVGLGSQQLTSNVAIGFQAFQTATSASAGGNVAIGDRALQSTAGAIFGNVAVGQLALAVNQGNRNIALGAQALTANTSGVNNIAIGYQALSSNTTDLGNIAIGNRVMYLLTGGGGDNVAIGGGGNLTNAGAMTILGASAANNYTTQGGQVAIGAYSLGGVSTFVTTGNQNTAVGYAVMSGITGGSSNVGLGHNALNALTSGNSNTGLGYFALVSNTTGSFNVAVGREALRYYTTTSNQVAIGYQALQGNSVTTLNTGTQNTAVGYQAGFANTSGLRNVFVGYQAGIANTSGINNNFIGNQAGFSNLTGGGNQAFGNGALYAVTTGNNHIAIGNAALSFLTGSIDNVGIGFQAAYSLVSGDANIVLGRNALFWSTSASNNVAIGYQAMLNLSNISNQTAIGYNALQGSATTTLNTGTQNTVVGYLAGTANTAGSNNTFVGQQAGDGNTSGSFNSYYGALTDGASTGSYQIALGNSVVTTGSNLGAWGGATNATRTDLGVGTFTPLGRIHIETLAAGNMGLYIAGSASQTGDLVEINATTTGQNYFTITGVGSVGIFTNLPSQALDVNGAARLRGRLFDGNNAAGTAGQLLSSTGSGVAWTTAFASGIFTGIGSVNIVPKFGSAFSLTTSNISDSGSQILFSSNTNTTGIATFRAISLSTTSTTQTAFMQFVGPFNDPITLNVGLATTGSISYNGSQGQLFTITNNLTSGSIFSVNDVSGIPSIDVNANGTILFAPYGGNIGVGTTASPDPFRVQTTSRFIGLATFGPIHATRVIYDNTLSPGALGQVLSSTNTGVAWSSVGALGIITGSGSANQITFWNTANNITGLSTFVFTSGNVGINTTAPLKKLHIRDSGLLIDGGSSIDAAPYGPRLVVDSQASTGHILADFRNNNGSVLYMTGSRVSIGNSSVVTNVLNVNGGDALINTLIVGLGSGQIATNTALGVSALAANTTGNLSLAVGYQAGLSNTNGIENTFVGYQAGRTNTSGSSNIALGGIALFANTTGGLNVAVGRGALTANTIGNNNAALGHGVLSANTSGSNNVAFGFLTLQNNVTTSGNTALGREALRYYANSSNQTAVGFGALQGNATVALNTGTGNVAVGYQAGLANTSGSNNTFVGESAGLANTSGSNNLFVGYQAGLANLTGSNNVALGYLNFASNTLGSFNFAAGGMNANTTGNSNSGAGLFSLNSNTTGSNNTAFGRDALRYWTTTSNQTAVGSGALQGNSTVALNTGSQNLAVGYQAGTANTSGFLNTYLGHQAGLANASGTHNTFIGATVGLASTSNNNTIVGAASYQANNLGEANIVVGSLSAQQNTSGSFNTVVGYNVFNSNTTGGNNAAFGFNALASNNTGSQNIAIGRYALRYYNQSSQVAVGDQALQGNSTVALNTGTQNTAVGFQAGLANTSGVRNVFIGYQVGLTNTSGSDNVAVGNQSLTNNQLGIQNIAVGSFALLYNVTGNYNVGIGQDSLRNFESLSTQVAIGYRALRGNDTRAQNTGFSNVAIGREALGISTSGSNNTALGTLAGTVNSTGNQNTFIGAQSGDGNTSGNSNTYLGYLTDGVPTGVYQIAIGDSVTPTASNQGAWGGVTNSTRTNLGIGTFTPLARIHAETLAAGNMGLYIAGAASQTADLIEVNATTNGVNYFTVTGIGSVGIYTALPSQAIDINGNARFRGAIYDSSNQVGVAGSVLSSTGAGVAWIAPGSGSGIQFFDFLPAQGTVSYYFDKTQTGSAVTAEFKWEGSNSPNLFWAYPDAVPDPVPTEGSQPSFRTISYLDFPLSGVTSSTYSLANISVNDRGVVIGVSSTIIIPSTALAGSYSGITSVGTLSQLIVSGFTTVTNIRVSGALYDFNEAPGVAGQILSSTNSGVAWTSVSATGIVTGTGTVNTVPKFNTANSLSNSNITDNGAQIILGSASSVSGILTSFGFFGPGTNLTNLNASNLASGVVPSLVISGSYSGITSVGNLTQLNVIGITTSTTFVGDGANLTNLNASNLTSGTVPSARVTGAYSGITSVGSLTALNVTGFSTLSNVRITNSLYDASFSPGTANQILISTGTGISWTTSTATGIVTGTGTVNTVPKFNNVNSLSNSNITDTGTAITLGSNASVSGILTSLGFFGPGTNLFDLNASNLFTGTVPSARVSGNYTGITSVGTLSVLNVTGIASAGTFVGVGTFTRLTSIADAIINTYTVGRGGGNIGGNTAMGGGNALANNTSGTLNSAVGWSALSANTTEGSNSAFGYDAGAYNKASQTTIMGARALSGSATTSNTGANNTVMGFGAGRYIASADNTAMGQGALAGNATTFSTGTGQNVAIGKDSMNSNQTGNTNTAVGRQSLYANTTGNANVAIGNNALFSATTATNNTAVGPSAMFYITTQGSQTAVGANALQGNSNTALNTGQFNTAIGNATGAANTSGSNNVFVGHNAGSANTSGNSNTFVGSFAGQSNNAGSNNTFVGSTAGGNNRSGINNTAVGLSAANQLTTGASNCYLGRQAAYYNISGNDNVAIGENAIFYFETSSNQIAIGRNALFGNATRALNTGGNNVAIGYAAGTAVTSGIGNVFVGHLAGDTITTGVSNIIIGNQADGLAGGSYQIALGELAVPVASNKGAWGGASNATRTDLGVGTFAPQARIHAQTLAAGNMGLYIAGAASQTAPLFEIDATTNGTQYFVINGIGSVGIFTSLPTQSLHVQNNARFSGQIYDFNNSPGAQVGIVSQVLTSTGTGVTWAPIKRSLVIPLMTAFNPTQVGIDSGIFIVPQDPINGTSTMTFNFRRVNVRVETPTAVGVTTINIAKATTTGAFIGTNILTTSINLTGSSLYEAFSTTFATGFTTCASGDKLAVNFVGVSTFHQNLTVELIAYEA